MTDILVTNITFVEIHTSIIISMSIDKLIDIVTQQKIYFWDWRQGVQPEFEEKFSFPIIEFGK